MAQLRQVPLTCSGHTRPVVDLHFSRNSNGETFLISACKDGKPMLRDGVTGDWLGTFEGHKGAVWSVHLDKEAKIAASGSADFTAKLWNVAKGEETLTLAHKHIVRAIKLHPDGNTVITGSNDKLIRRYDLNKGGDQDAIVLQGHTSAVKYVVCLDDEKTLLSVGDDKVLKIWDLTSNECVDTIQLPEPAQSLQMAPDGKSFLLTHGNKVTEWNTDDRKMIKEFTMERPVYAASLHSSRQFLVCGGEDFQMYKLDYETGEKLESYKGHFGPVHCCSFSPDGELYASGSEDGTLRLWQTTVGNTYGLWKFVDAAVAGAAVGDNVEA